MQQRPPWYWRLIGRQYWSGWYIRGLILSGSYGWYFKSEPAPKPPTPEDMVRTTVAAINEKLETVYQHQMTMRPLPDLAERFAEVDHDTPT